MSLLGQASGAWTESSSALRILYAGIRNSLPTLTPDAFTQTNPPLVTTAGTVSTSAGLLGNVRGVLSGSVAFTRPDVGASRVGGPVDVAISGITASQGRFTRPLGCFINSAAGNAYENLPAAASNKGPYVSAMGSYGNRLYETQFLTAVAPFSAGNTIPYVAGQTLIASMNGYLMPSGVDNSGAFLSTDVASFALEVDNGASASTPIGILLMPFDSVMAELVYDQRI